jgi:2-(1,2-epoxy-1,2-dihydrophenyl)acetyl-CoA isomerase
MSSLRVDRHGAIARLTLDRPDAGNALNLELARALRDNVAVIGRDESVAVVHIDAAGPLFCGGGDLAEMSGAESPQKYVHELAATVHEALLTLATSDKVVVGAVQGAAAGGGFGLVLNCDYVVVAESATFVSAYSKVGLSPDCGSSYLLPRVVGSTRATEFVLTSRQLDAATALEWGIVNAVAPADEVAAAAERIAEKIAAVPATARAASKRLLNAAWLPGYQEHLDRERDSIAELAGGEESTRLRAAFLQKVR